MSAHPDRYKRRLPPTPELLFLTNDADNRKRAAAEGLTAMTTVVGPLFFVRVFFFFFFPCLRVCCGLRALAQALPVGGHLCMAGTDIPLLQCSCRHPALGLTSYLSIAVSEC